MATTTAAAIAAASSPLTPPEALGAEQPLTRHSLACWAACGLSGWSWTDSFALGGVCGWSERPPELWRVADPTELLPIPVEAEAAAVTALWVARSATMSTAEVEAWASANEWTLHPVLAPPNRSDSASVRNNPSPNANGPR